MCSRIPKNKNRIRAPPDANNIINTTQDTHQHNNGDTPSPEPMTETNTIHGQYVIMTIDRNIKKKYYKKKKYIFFKQNHKISPK